MILFLAAALASEPPLQPDAYRLDVTIATLVRVPFAGETTVRTNSTALAMLSRDGESWTVEQTLCAVAVDDDLKMSTTIVPDAFVAAHPVQTYAADVVQREGVWSFAADPGPSDIGFDGAVTGGDLPDGRKDAGVVDFDGDGKPGATMVLDVPVFGEVSVYVAQRGHSRYRGTLGEGAVSGQVEVVEMDQRTLGASNPFFKSDPKVTLDPTGSVFTLVRAPGAHTCADLVPP